MVGTQLYANWNSCPLAHMKLNGTMQNLLRFLLLLLLVELYALGDNQGI